jgi:hypothetical protein
MHLKVIKPQIYKPNQSVEYIKQYIARADQLIDYLYDLPVEERMEYDDDSIMELQELRRQAEGDLNNLVKPKNSLSNYKFQTFAELELDAAKENRSVAALVNLRLKYLQDTLLAVNLKISQLVDIPENEKFLVSDLLESNKKIKNKIEKEINQYSSFNFGNQKINIDQAKEKALAYPITDLIPHQSVKKGQNLHMYKSPLRDERTASFAVYTASNTAYDFGTGTKYDSISLYMALNNADFMTAIKNLQ